MMKALEVIALVGVVLLVWLVVLTLIADWWDRRP